MKNKTCCCIGHRKIEITDKLKKDMYDYIENLIVNENVKTFLFGSRSEFNVLCHSIVTDLKKKYPDIKRIGYTCRSEIITLENEREKLEKLYSHLKKQDVHLLGFEEEFEHKKKYSSGKGSYVERNEALINDSDYCLLYYNENYTVPQRKRGKYIYYQPKSGTAIAYKYAKQKNKIIKNFFNN